MTEAASKKFFEELGSNDAEEALQSVDENVIFIAMRKESSDQVLFYLLPQFILGVSMPS
ncbi:hypothetical protein [Metabacillus arenae]|uniref:Uncharacterized protein n=1 Tax=Metabacillus arenae TaxID=2771434 RepID=A0A926RY86_9BACI|nr:hypothetical protein [Metabacillus arenae]MBD1381796.1 hypothetical protein [Metabacillus arenae]